MIAFVVILALAATPATVTPERMRADIVAWASESRPSDPDTYHEYQQLAPRFLKSKNRQERLAGAWALARIGNSEHVRALCAAMKDRDPDVQREAARALGAIGNDKAVPDLERHIAADGGASLESVAALERIGTGSALSALQRLHKRIPLGGVGIAIADSIKRLEGKP